MNTGDTILQEFQQFLIDHNALESFIANLDEKNLTNKDHIKVIINCFLWSTTKEGQGFWHDLYWEWFHRYEHLDNQYTLEEILSFLLTTSQQQQPYIYW